MICMKCPMLRPKIQSKPLTSLRLAKALMEFPKIWGNSLSLSFQFSSNVCDDLGWIFLSCYSSQISLTILTCYLALSKQVENCTLTSTYKSILLSYVNKRDSSLFNKSLLAITIYCLESRKFVGLSSVTYKSPYPSIFVEKDAYHTFNKRRHQSTEALEACLN